MRFTIRDLLWLMVVAALAVSWWNERRQSLIREVDIAGREASIAHRERMLKADFQWLLPNAIRSVNDAVKMDDLLYYPPDPNDL